MKTKTEEQIAGYINRKIKVTPKELFDHFDISDRAIRKQLKKLYEKGILAKVGKPPKVYYLIKEKIKHIEDKLFIESSIEKIINENFLFVTPSGEEKEGLEGFKYWCNKFNLPVEKTTKEYIKTLKKYNSYKKDGLIDGMYKFRNTFKKVHLDHIFYIDFYSIERFGKTKPGQILLYAKQSQNKVFIRRLTKYVKTAVDQIIKRFKTDGVGFIPPTVKREVQLIKELAKNLKLKNKTISIVKIKTPIIVPQKTLNKLNDRIENARDTIIVDENMVFKNVLLIDDAVGSGATLNETAKKIRERKICKGNIIGLAITGSFKGFDVISEV